MSMKYKNVIINFKYVINLQSNVTIYIKYLHHFSSFVFIFQNKKRKYYRLVDAVGGKKRSYMEFRFENDSLYFDAYKDNPHFVGIKKLSLETVIQEPFLVREPGSTTLKEVQKFCNENDIKINQLSR